MRKQQQVWEEEHQKSAAFPSYKKSEPSSMVVEFVKFLETNGLKPPLKIVDIGCGKGRNAIYLAGMGHKVWALDYSQAALDYAQKAAENAIVADQIEFMNLPIDSQWPFEDNNFDIAVDCFSSIDIETGEGREKYRSEMMRTLKPGGYAMVAVVSADDEFEKEMIRKHPGKEPNSTIWPGNHKFQKDYSVKELEEFYRDFVIVEIRKMQKPAEKMGKKFLATNLFAILQKPIGK